MARVFIGLGSNLDDPRAQIERALEELSELPSTQVIQSSSLYASRAVGPEQPDYINAVLEMESTLEPMVLLDSLQAIELAHKRVRLEHWGPRTLDLDILLIDQQIIQTERLKVPHPFLTQRNFVLYPLAEIAPDARLPDGTPVASLLDQVGPDGLELVVNEDI